MPKIPTFESKGRLTTEAPSIKTGIQVSPTATPAAGLLSATDALVDYSIKKRDIAEKIESQKVVNVIKGDLDITIEQQKDNINEGEALINLEKSYKSKLNEKINGLTNRRVKERVKNLLDLEYSGYVNKIKKNSYSSLEKETEKTTNETLTSIAAEYNQATTDEEKAKIRNKGVNVISTVASDFMFPENKKKEKLDAFDRVLLFGTFNSIAGTENAVENIIAKDKEFGGEKTNTNEEFSAGVLNAYDAKINEITIKGDPNADYDKAKQMIEQLKTVKRSNGFKLDQGAVSKKIDTLKEKILKEEVLHENLINKQGENKQFEDFAKDSKIGLLKSITDKGMGIPTSLEDRLMANEIEAEFDQMKNDFLAVNAEATLGDKKSFVRNLTSTLNNIYQDRKIERIKSRSFTEDTFDIIAERNQVIKDVKLLSENKLDVTTRKRYEKIAKINGYVTTVKTKNEDGKVTKTQTVGDIGAFLNDYLPTLVRQVKITEIKD